MDALPSSDIEEICRGLGDDVHQFSGQRVLISGALGFLGKYLTQVFLRLNTTTLAKPCQVLAVDNLLTSGDTGAQVRTDPNLTFIEHDIVEPYRPDLRIDLIIHAAGIASPQHYRKWPLETIEVATRGLKNVLDLARTSGSRLLSFSSSEIYGDPGPANIPTPESYNGNVSPLGRRSCYDESKRLGETLLRVYAESFGVEGVIVRPFNVYGPGMHRYDYRIMPTIAAGLIDGEPVRIYGTGRQTRTFCYATDAVRGFLLALLYGRSGEPYNIGAESPEVSMLDLIEFVRAAAPAPGLRTQIVEHPDSYPNDEPHRRCPDITKAREHLGYQPTVGLADGLRRFLTWATVAYR
jgi:UDP-glucuronate decarboxylase